MATLVKQCGQGLILAAARARGSSGESFKSWRWVWARGAEQNAPLGRAVLGGLFFATLLTLFVVPAFYSIFSRHLKGKH